MRLLVLFRENKKKKKFNGITNYLIKKDKSAYLD